MIALGFDIETAPDVERARAVLGLDSQMPDAEVAAEMAKRRLDATDGRSDFLAPGWHRIVAVGLAGLDVDTRALRVVARCEADEAALIGLVGQALTKRPRLYTWNGSAFDLPVLRTRAMILGESLPHLHGLPNAKQWERYLYRYGDQHVDLADELSGYGAASRMKLDEVAQLCGLHGKPEASADVWAYWQAGEVERIERQVRHDAVTTLRLGLRYEYLRARLEPDTYHRADTVLADAARRPELAHA